MAVSTDAIVLLREDHKEIRRLFRQFQAAGKDAEAEKRRVAEKIIEALTVHTYIENETMYPEVRRLLPDLEDDVLESYEEHHMDEEEQEWFPEVRAGLGRNQLNELGEQMIEQKKTAPRSPAQPSALKKAVDAIIS